MYNKKKVRYVVDIHGYGRNLYELRDRIDCYFVKKSEMSTYNMRYSGLSEMCKDIVVNSIKTYMRDGGGLLGYEISVEYYENENEK